jgi:hypothetical protein
MRWMAALVLLVLLFGGCAARGSQSSTPGFQEERKSGEGGPNGGMSGGSM